MRAPDRLFCRAHSLIVWISAQFSYSWCHPCVLISARASLSEILLYSDLYIIYILSDPVAALRRLFHEAGSYWQGSYTVAKRRAKAVTHWLALLFVWWMPTFMIIVWSSQHLSFTSIGKTKTTERLVPSLLALFGIVEAKSIERRVRVCQARHFFLVSDWLRRRTYRSYDNRYFCPSFCGIEGEWNGQFTDSKLLKQLWKVETAPDLQHPIRKGSGEQELKKTKKASLLSDSKKKANGETSIDFVVTDYEQVAPTGYWREHTRRQPQRPPRTPILLPRPAQKHADALCCRSTSIRKRTFTAYGNIRTLDSKRRNGRGESAKSAFKIRSTRPLSGAEQRLFESLRW